MKDNLIQYEHSLETPWYMKMTLNNSSVAVGEAAGAGDGQEWEIIDGFNGKQLAFRRLTDDHTTPADIWPDLMMKAHCELLTLEQMAREQFQRDNRFTELMVEAQEAATRIDIMIQQLTPTGNSQADLTRLGNTVARLTDAHDLLDELTDPDEED